MENQLPNTSIQSSPLPIQNDNSIFETLLDY